MSVIVPMRNAETTVAETVCSLFGQATESSWELIIVDNGSEDGSLRAAELAVSSTTRPATLRRAEVCSYPDRIGHASPRNHGVARSNGWCITFCGADDLVGPRWVDELLRALRRHPYVASRQVRLGDDPDEGGGSTVPVRFGLPTAYGSGLACTRALFDDLGGFSPDFDGGGEDGDFALRAWRDLGTSPVLAEDAVYFFRLNSTASSNLRQGYRDGRTQVRLRHAYREVIDEPPTGWRTAPHRLASAARTAWRGRDRDSVLLSVRMLGYTAGRAAWSTRLREPCF